MCYTRGPGAYKIPGFKDIPIQMSVSLLRNSLNVKAVHSSKAVGEVRGWGVGGGGVCVYVFVWGGGGYVIISCAINPDLFILCYVCGVAAIISRQCSFLCY